MSCTFPDMNWCVSDLNALPLITTADGKGGSWECIKTLPDVALLMLFISISVSIYLGELNTTQ